MPTKARLCLFPNIYLWNSRFYASWLGTLLLVIIITLLIPVRAAQAVETYSLPDNQWHMLALPLALPVSQNTVAAVFGDDFEDQTYGVDWLVYEFVLEQQQYRLLDIDESLVLGRGYWILQRTGSEVVLTAPDGARDAAGIRNQMCFFSDHCVPVETANQWPSGERSWAMIGKPVLRRAEPLFSPTQLADLWVFSTGAQCSLGPTGIGTGCPINLGSSSGGGLPGGDLRMWVPTAEEYQIVEYTSTVPDWRALWISADNPLLEDQPGFDRPRFWAAFSAPDQDKLGIYCPCAEFLANLTNNGRQGQFGFGAGDSEFSQSTGEHNRYNFFLPNIGVNAVTVGDLVSDTDRLESLQQLGVLSNTPVQDLFLVSDHPYESNAFRGCQVYSVDLNTFDFVVDPSKNVLLHSQAYSPTLSQQQHAACTSKLAGQTDNDDQTQFTLP